MEGAAAARLPAYTRSELKDDVTRKGAEGRPRGANNIAIAVHAATTHPRQRIRDFATDAITVGSEGEAEPETDGRHAVPVEFAVG